MDDREELGGVGARVLDHRGVLQMLAEIGVATAIAGKPVCQQMGIRRHTRLEKGAEFGAGGGQALVVLVADHDLGAFFQAAAGGGTADAGAGRRCDHDDLAVQQVVAVHVRGSPRALVAMMLR